MNDYKSIQVNTKQCWFNKKLTGVTIVLSCILSLCSAASYAQTLNISDDAHIDLVDGNANFGTNPNLSIQNTTVTRRNGENQVFLSFNLDSLPSGLTDGDVVKALLRVWVDQVTVPGFVNIHMVTSPWDEHSITGVMPPSTIPLALIEFVAEDEGHYKSIDITSAVTDWTRPSTTLANYGLALIADPYTQVDIRLDSKENPQTSHPSEIVVTLTGSVGPQGEQGIQGEPGIAGTDGVDGATGPIGPEGPQGLIGPLGPQGEQGMQGEPGNDGTDGANGATGPTGPAGPQGLIGLVGPQGEQGIQGEPGNDGADGAQGPIGPEGPEGTEGPQGDPGEGNTINLTIDATEFPGIVADDFNALFPDEANNKALVEIEGIAIGPFQTIIINGPAFEIQTVLGFDSAGDPLNESGLNMELPLVIEPVLDDPNNGSFATTLLLDYFDNYDPLSPMPITISINITDASGAPTVGWALYEYEPDSYVAGFDGRTRFTLRHTLSPDNAVGMERNPGIFDNSASINLATDRRVEISSLFSIGPYPAVELDDSEMAGPRLTLIWDYVEGGTAYFWAREIAETGTTSFTGKKQMNLYSVPVITGGIVNDTIERNYFGCFPIKYEQFTGFGQDIKLKERLIVQCDTYETS